MYRHPKTTQELRNSQDKHDTLVRAKRRNLPTAYDDIQVADRGRVDKGKDKGGFRGELRKILIKSTQPCRYNWHNEYSMLFYAIIDDLERAGANIIKQSKKCNCYEWCVSWYGPDINPRLRRRLEEINNG